MGGASEMLAHPVDACGLYTDECLAWAEQRLCDVMKGELVERTRLLESKCLHGWLMEIMRMSV